MAVDAVFGGSVGRQDIGILGISTAATTAMEQSILCPGLLNQVNRGNRYSAGGVTIIVFLRSLVRGIDLLAIRWQDDNSLSALVSFWADCMASALFDIARAVLFILMGASDLLSHSLFFLVVG